jgi:chemotaxis protein methyltransferase CheR
MGLEPDIEEIELALLLDGVERRYGHRLRDWDATAVRTRVEEMVAEGGFASISAFQEQLLREDAWLARMMSGLWSRPNRGMFADAAFWRAIRWKIVPVLRTWPSIRVWVAGCATGEDAWSLAVMLEEESLGNRTVIHATDLDEAVLDEAREGWTSTEALRAWETSYRMAGGPRGLAGAFEEDGERARLKAPYRERIAWSRHVPGIEPSFNEFHLILFRNPFVWADSRARERVGALLRESQVVFGFLCLDRPETLQCLPRETWSFVDRELAIARRVA